jgi:hypothetical protein
MQTVGVSCDHYMSLQSNSSQFSSNNANSRSFVCVLFTDELKIVKVEQRQLVLLQTIVIICRLLQIIVITTAGVLP